MNEHVWSFTAKLPRTRDRNRQGAVSPFPILRSGQHFERPLTPTMAAAGAREDDTFEDAHEHDPPPRSTGTKVNLGTIKKLTDGNHIVGLELFRAIPDPQIPQCETCALSKMKTPTISQKKMETMQHRTWIEMSIDAIGPFDKSVEGHH